MLISIVPPHNDCGVRIVMYRHLLDRKPFDLHVVSTADFDANLVIDTKIRIPSLLYRLKKSRLGRTLSKWIQDYENHVWPLTISRDLQQAIDSFKPNVIITLAETGLCHMASRAAQRNNIPLVGLFLDWFPIMHPYCGHEIFQPVLTRRYEKLYNRCDLAICTSDGMRDILGKHRNSHVVYPIPGKHIIPRQTNPPYRNKFRLVYVGAAERFYGRMLRSLLDEIRGREDMELIIVGPTGDWPEEELNRARAEGSCLGFMPPDQAAEVLAGADSLLVVMSFEPEQERFMRTSFTTKFLDYASFHKPIILWGPDYCTPMQVAKLHDAALVIPLPHASHVLAAIEHLSHRPDEVQRYSDAANRMHQGIFNPDRLQDIFVTQIEAIARV